jgi:hypothetical protein
MCGQLSSFVQFEEATRPVTYRVDAISFQSYNSEALGALEAPLARTWTRGEDADAQDALAGLFVAGITAVGP